MEKLSQKQKEAFSQSTARINIFEGPVRAGKSFSAILRWIDFCLNGPKGPLVICGRTDKTIKRNIITPLQDLLGNAVVYKQGKGEVQLYNRTMYVVGANDDRAEAKIRGSEFAGALLDEVTLLPESFFKMLLSRLSIPGASLFASTNPDSPYHWLKRDFLDRRDELDLRVFTFNIRDNPSLSDKYIKDLSSEYHGLWYQRYIEGKWVLAEGAVYDFFDQGIHVIDSPPGPADYYIVGIDYGTTNPCAFTLIGYNGGTYPNMWLEKEYYYDSSAERRQKSDYEYCRDLEDFLEGVHVKAIYLDPSAASLKQEMKRQGLPTATDASNDVLPGVRFVSQLLTNGTFKVCSNCTETITEFSNYLWDAKATAKGKDQPLKQQDHCFVAGTLVTTTRGKVTIESVKSGDKGDYVLTRSGWNKVHYNFVNKAETILVNVLGKKIECTPNHPFLTLRGWKNSEDLIESDMFFINLNELKECQWSLPSTGLIIEDIQLQLIKVIGHITEQEKQTALKDTDISIETFGSSTMETFHPATMFITSTGIQKTMTLGISCFYQLASIFPIMVNILQKSKEQLEESIATELESSQNNGIVVKKEESGIESMHKTPLEKFPTKNIPARNVEIDSNHLNKPTQDFVRISVKANGEDTLVWMMRKETALTVLKNLESIDFQKQHVAPSLVVAKNRGEKEVYNLHVDHQHEYYVEDILVHNCMDSLRYALFSHFFNINLGEEMEESDAERYEHLYRRPIY